MTVHPAARPPACMQRINFSQTTVTIKLACARAPVDSATSGLRRAKQQAPGGRPSYRRLAAGLPSTSLTMITTRLIRSYLGVMNDNEICRRDSELARKTLFMAFGMLLLAAVVAGE